jgi:hypothetical protein
MSQDTYFVKQARARGVNDFRPAAVHLEELYGCGQFEHARSCATQPPMSGTNAHRMPPLAKKG